MPAWGATVTPTMEFRMLGPLEVAAGGSTIPLGGSKQRGVLALLLLNANQVVSSDRLIDEVWGETPPERAKAALQVYVSNLRKALGDSGSVLVTQAPGYVLRVDPDKIDLHRFEVETAGARQRISQGRMDEASTMLRTALGLWRGSALADFAYEPFAQGPIGRLEELRLAAFEDLIDADLALGKHGELVGELEGLTARHPLRERLTGQLVLALYRSGRQAEALETYRNARRLLVDELGIEPGQALQELERAILRQESSLDLAPAAASAAALPDSPERAILLVAGDPAGLTALARFAEPLAVRSQREIILAMLVGQEGELAASTSALRERRTALLEHGLSARAAGFTSEEPGKDAARLAAEQSVDFLLLDGTTDLVRGDEFTSDVDDVLTGAPCDVGVLVSPAGNQEAPGPERAVLVPFGGAEHEWAAIEFGAWLAGATGAPLRLAGSAANPAKGKRDASRLLAAASLVVQEVAGVAAEPLLVPPGSEGVVAAAEGAGLVVLGLSDRWRQEGIGQARLAVARGASVPTILVRGGVRPGGLAPREGLTRYTWTMAAR
jgi:DNA-binding SARP family transcriptional activator